MKICMYLCMYLYDSVYGTGLLTKSAVNALGHINIVLSSTSGVIGSGLSLNSDGSRGTGGLT